MPKPSGEIVPDDDRKGPQGRPRSGPRNLAVRQLPRVTVRALGRTLARWEALLDVTGMQGHAVFDELLSAYLLNAVPDDVRREVEKRARRIKADRYADLP